MRLLLMMTSHFGFHEMIRESLEKMGYEVTYLDVPAFRYANFQQRCENFFRKTFFKNKNFKNQLKTNALEEHILAELDYPENYFDYCLVIRPDQFTEKIAAQLQRICRKTIAYQWDGFSRFSLPDGLIYRFDVFAIFDKDDYDKYKSKFRNLKLTHNFYFDISKSCEKDLDLVYFGTLDDERKLLLKHFANIANELNFKTYFKLFINNQKKKIATEENRLKIDNQILSYKEMVKISCRAKCLLDFKFEGHSGLSFRFFEALHFRQKIITNNPTAELVDFYQRNNILIFNNIEELTREKIQEFLSSEYETVEQEIVENYSFENWWNTIKNL